MTLTAAYLVSIKAVAFLCVVLALVEVVGLIEGLEKDYD